jgi:hypothetical protein
MSLYHIGAFAVSGRLARSIFIGAAAIVALSQPASAQDTNACPVDGCKVSIVGVEKDGDELKLTFDANYSPDMAKNHIHVWWGENYNANQVTNNAESEYHVKQGVWHPTADYPTYVTQSGASVSERGAATTLCVTAADRNHDVLDVDVVECRDVSDMLK